LIKNILVAVDGSDNAKRASEYAFWMANAFGAALSGVHVVDLIALEGPFLHDLSGSLGFEPFQNFSTEMKKILEADGQSVLDDFKKEGEKAGLKTDTTLAMGLVSNEICDKARLADVVVIGKAGINAKFDHGMMGAVAEGVVRKSEKPVFIAPATFKAPVKPLLCYDARSNSTKAMHSAAEFAKAAGLPLTIVTVSTENAEGDALLDEARSYLEPYGVKAEFRRLDGDDAATLIENFYKDNNYDLLFMGGASHSGIIKIVLGSTTEHMVRAVEGPFFIER
jgi:nucleotide-binding universal stress UspA family protein